MNERDWFQSHEPQFKAAKADFETFALALGQRLQKLDPEIPKLPGKDLFFRIYRDVRFSNDRTPYKTYFAAGFSRTGRKGPYAKYYLSVKPNDMSVLACGSWQPDSVRLAKLRRFIDRHYDAFDEVVSHVEFVDMFCGKAGLLKTVDQLKKCPKVWSTRHIP